MATATETKSTEARQPSTEKVERSLQHIAKKNRETRNEYRLQYMESGDKDSGITKGDYTPRIYASEHAVMCAQALHNGYAQPRVNAVTCEVQATDIIRSFDYDSEAE
jgi:hypothetical protein